MVQMLEVRNLRTQFKVDNGIVQAVDGVSYHIDHGEIVGIVGESGCGKSVTQLSLLQLISSPPGKIMGGEALFEGVDLLKFKSDSEQMRKIRGGNIGIIFQEPMTSLNPVLTIGQQIVESVMLHLKMDSAAARKHAVEQLKLVGITDAEQRIDNYPHQFSGGMRQRAMIAMAMACRPKLLIADEPTTALDVTTQAQILELLKDTVKHFDTSLLIVTHNLGVVARYAQRIYVMYAGRVVESGTSNDIFANPRHPYTIGLLKAVPRLDEPKGHKLVPINGLPPSLINRPPMCAFLLRCSYRTEKCYQEPWPELKVVDGQHCVSCYVDLPAKKLGSGGNVTILQLMNTAGMKDPSAELSDIVASTVSQKDQLTNSTYQSSEEILLEAKNLKMYFSGTKGFFKHEAAQIKAVDDVSFKVRKGETLGLVGESGCGKTTVARCILQLYSPTGGGIHFEGRNILGQPKRGLRNMRRRVQLIFQDPYSSLDPRQTAGSIIGEPLKVHKMVASKQEYSHRVAELFEMVGLDPSMEDRVPHEFSGGQRQRIGIARALATNPSLIVCDEPISALDVSIQAQIINLLEELQEKLGLTYLFIAHDLSVVRHISDRVAVMYLGRIVEITDWKSLYENPLHPYTKALLSAVPIPDPFVEEKRERIILRGEVPSLLNRPTGCCFHPRCSEAIEDCSSIVPTLKNVGGGHEVACIKM
ncbi:MAG: ABC transporter ATP-binding protein [Bacillota bacterium]|nr:ABC transporter ATP-binding protein [Bacillota bacterium]